MTPVLQRTFGRLPRNYYLRQLAFGSVIAGLLVTVTLRNPQANHLGAIIGAAISTLLYPFSRFVFVRTVAFIAGKRAFLFRGSRNHLMKFFAMVFCWASAIIIAPLGLIFLYFTRKSGARPGAPPNRAGNPHPPTRRGPR